MATKPDDETTGSSLPPEMLELIFSKLDQKYLEPVALVSKSFLSIVRSIVRKLTFACYIPNTVHLHRIFDRFPSVKEITLSYEPTEHVLLAISNSKLDLQTLRLLHCPYHLQYDAILAIPPSSRITSTLRCLQISWYVFDITPIFIDEEELSSNSEQFIRFIELFPLLTELDLSRSQRWNDRLIRRITSKLRNLRKLVLHGNMYITDETLATLSTNCVYLEHLGVGDCIRMTPGGVRALILSCKHLHSLEDLPQFVRDSSEVYIEPDCANPELIELMETMSSSENLKLVSFGWRFLARDVILRTFAKSRPPLPTLTIHTDRNTRDANYSMAAVSEMIRACRGRLTSLDLQLPLSDRCGTQDREMSVLVARLPHLERVTIRSASSMDEPLRALRSNCAHLEKARVYWRADVVVTMIDVVRQDENSFSITRTCVKFSMPADEIY